MKYWLLNHYYSNYLKRNDIFGIPVKKNKETGELLKDNNGNLIPKFSYCNDINIGDKVVYYCPAPKMFVLGIFNIIDGPGMYFDEWNENIQYRIKPEFPIDENNFVSYHDLLKELSFFKDKEGNQLEGRSAALKMIGTIKEISKEDFEKIVELYTGRKTGDEKILVSEDPLHLRMIKASHLIANQFQCFSYIGSQERKRVQKLITEEESSIYGENQMEEIPYWLQDIGTQLKTIKRILYIDNIWFCEESPGFFIPFAVFEHEKDNNLRSVMDRFNALYKTINSNNHLKEISPLYFLIAEDKNQVSSYKNRIASHGEWSDFQKKNKFYIFSFEDIEKQNPDFVSIITKHLKDIPFSEREYE
ncbi:MAG: hypothetical protein ACTSRH_10500 [Promethearchaeota archaeon]